MRSGRLSGFQSQSTPEPTSSLFLTTLRPNLGILVTPLPGFFNQDEVGTRGYSERVKSPRGMQGRLLDVCSPELQEVLSLIIIPFCEGSMRVSQENSSCFSARKPRLPESTLRNYLTKSNL